MSEPEPTYADKHGVRFTAYKGAWADWITELNAQAAEGDTDALETLETLERGGIDQPENDRLRLNNGCDFDADTFSDEYMQEMSHGEPEKVREGGDEEAILRVMQFLLASSNLRLDLHCLANILGVPPISGMSLESIGEVCSVSKQRVGIRRRELRETFNLRQVGAAN